MGVEQVRYCDLCGGSVDERAGRLTVPQEHRPQVPREESDGMMFIPIAAILSGRESLDVFDICRPCVEAMLYRVYQHRLAARQLAAQKVADNQVAVLTEATR